MSENKANIAPDGGSSVVPVDSSAIYTQAATSDNTRQAYQSDIHQFLQQGYSLPTTVVQLQHYLNASAAIHNPRTIQRRLIALRQWHRLQNHPDPTIDPAIRQTLRGIARVHGQPKQQAPALSLSDLDRLLDHLRRI